MKKEHGEEAKEKLAKEQETEKRKEKEERAKILKQQTQNWQNKLISVLWEFDGGEMYVEQQEDDDDDNKSKSSRSEEDAKTKRKAEKDAQIEKSRVLSTYNICGDKALHICMLVAYSHPNDCPARIALLEVAKELIKKCNSEASLRRDNDGHNSGRNNSCKTSGRYVVSVCACVQVCWKYVHCRLCAICMHFLASHIQTFISCETFA
jgi:hypothetical protein